MKSILSILLALVISFFMTNTTINAQERLFVGTGLSEVLEYNAVNGNFIDIIASNPPVTALDLPVGIRFGLDGNLYVSSFFSSEVFRFDGTTGELIDVFVPAGSGGLNDPLGIEFGPDGNLYVSSSGTDQILRYNGTNGNFIDVFIAAGSGGLDNPSGAVSSAPTVISMLAATLVTRYFDITALRGISWTSLLPKGAAD